MTSIQQIVHAYHAMVFYVCNNLAYRGFECIRNNLTDMGITLNVTPRNEHVPEVKRYIRTIKKSVRVIASSPEMVYNVIFGQTFSRQQWSTFNNQPKDPKNMTGN